jgi:hypothetical protein
MQAHQARLDREIEVRQRYEVGLEDCKALLHQEKDNTHTLEIRCRDFERQLNEALQSAAEAEAARAQQESRLLATIQDYDKHVQVQHAISTSS